MRDTLPWYPLTVECGIVNLNRSNQAGSHWVCYYRNKNDGIYFDSYGQITPVEIQRYLKTSSEIDRGKRIQISYKLQIRHCVVFSALKPLTIGKIPFNPICTGGGGGGCMLQEHPPPPIRNSVI